MRPESEYRQAVRLIEAGVNDCEVGRRLDVPRGTIKTWREGLTTPTVGRTKGRGGRQKTTCFRCEGTSLGDFRQQAYAYLLGAYLGDGTISEMKRGVFSLRVSCDRKYPEIIEEIATHIVLVRGVDAVGFAQGPGCVVVNAYWKHWPCVFPQHGPGRKHERPILLESWQEEVVASYPRELLRGLIQTDGCRSINEVPRRLKNGIKRYRYPRYQFSNASVDIQRIFIEALEGLGIGWTRLGPRDLSIARRDDVALLDTFIGPKS